MDVCCQGLRIVPTLFILPIQGLALREVHDTRWSVWDEQFNGSIFIHGGKFDLGHFPNRNTISFPRNIEVTVTPRAASWRELLNCTLKKDAGTSNFEWDPLSSFPPPHSFFCPHPLRQATKTTLNTS
jgi:hypothetical protein